MENLYGLILAGGSGTRLWPISREYYPKQFLKLIGNKTLIQKTFTRLKKIIPPERIYITTNRIFVDEVISQLKKFGLNKENIIIQPTDKNTAPAIAQASKRIFDKDETAVIVNCPSDHLIRPDTEFTSSLKIGYKLAQKNLLVTFGVKPKQPNPEYGYINPDKSTSIKIGLRASFKVKKFIEKPNIKDAAKLIRKGCLWNSGIFIWKVRIILNEIRKLDKGIYRALNSNKRYFLLDSIPIDKSILEKSNLVWVIPVSFEWKDIGSWKALYELLPKDSDQNVLNKWVVSHNSHNSLIYGTEGRSVAALNLKDIVIVDTKDSVFIAPRESVHEIKNVLIQGKERPLVTIITPTYNDYKFIEDTIMSILNQSYKNIECIVIDGGSTDGTVDIINKYIYRVEHFLTMPNTGRFEKMNKAIELANGEIIGIISPGDSYNDSDAIETIVENMEKDRADVGWGNLIYVAKENEDKIIMYWKSSIYKKGIFQKGWIPPHPTFFVRKSVYEKYKGFNIKYRIAAEYELMLRLLERHKVRGVYIPRTLVKMRGKGLTFKSIFDRVAGNIESFRSWEENGLKVNPIFLFSKNVSKIQQFWKKKDLQLYL